MCTDIVTVDQYWSACESCVVVAPYEMNAMSWVMNIIVLVLTIGVGGHGRQLWSILTNMILRGVYSTDVNIHCQDKLYVGIGNM